MEGPGAAWRLRGRSKQINSRDIRTHNGGLGFRV